MGSAVTAPRHQVGHMRKHQNDRHKRKYGEKRKAATEHNRAKKPGQHATRMERLLARTERLLGQDVRVRVPGYVNPLVGTVAAILHKDDEGYPKAAKRHSGSYVTVRTTGGTRTVSRHRIKTIKKES